MTADPPIYKSSSLTTIDIKKVNYYSGFYKDLVALMNTLFFHYIKF